MSRGSIYLEHGAEGREEYRHGLDHLRAASGLLALIGDADASVVTSIIEDAWKNDCVLEPAKAGGLAAILLSLANRLVGDGIVGADLVLDDNLLERLRSEPVREHLAIDPRRGTDARYALVEAIGDIEGVARLLDRAAAEQVRIVLE